MTADAAMTTQTLPLDGQKKSLMTAIAFMLLGVAGLFPNFILSAYMGPIGLGYIAALTVGAMMLNFQFAFSILVICLFLQNLFIAIVMPIVPGVDQFTPMLATSFINVVLTAGFAAVLWMRNRNQLPTENRALMRAMVLFFAIIVIYSGLGAIHATLNDALIYMRVYVVGGFLLIAGIAFGLYLPSNFPISIFRATTFFLVVWGLAEFFLTYDLYSIFHIADYINLKYASSTTMNVTNVQQAINFASRSYLNLSGALGLKFDILRPQGPNIHPISYAYALAFGAIVCYVYRFHVLMIGALALLALVGAKGPLLMAYLSLILSTMYIISRRSNWVLILLVAIMFFYTTIGVVYGMYTEDYHVVGLMGGVRGFLHNPIGYGVGVGGNLSSMTMQYADFHLFQGYGATFALESAFGVMIYQIGICTIFFLIFYWQIWKGVWKTTQYFPSEPRLVAIPFALALLLVNSVFQEEAFSPAGWGPLMLLSGLLLARRWQQEKFQITVNV